MRQTYFNMKNSTDMGCVMKNITVSLPDDIAKAVEEIVERKSSFRKRSYLFVEALREYIQAHFPECIAQEKTTPIVLSGIKKRVGLRGPSLALRGRARLEGFRIEE